MGFLNSYLSLNSLAITILICLLTFSSSLLVIQSYALSNLTIIPKNSHPFGKPFSEWTANWWKYYIETPFDDKHPSKDRTGANCDRNQSGPVWFLSGSEIVPIEKTCAIPAGKAILIPILNYECSYAEDKRLKTPADLTKCAKSGVDVMNLLHLKYDEINIPQEQIRQDFRVATSPFTVNFPADNVFDAKPAGLSTAVSDGYWVMFSAPPPGKYDIKFGGCGGGAAPTGPPAYTLTAGFCQDVTYHLNILSP
jgi:hypothetical protein